MRSGRTIVISDIHGCGLTLELLLHRISLSSEDHLILLGDYINRGPRSKQVLDLFFELESKGQKLTLLKGNHEVMLLDAWHDPQKEDRWLRAGGWTTLQSFKVTSVREIPEYYLKKIECMLDHYSDHQAIYVHGGLDFSLEDPLQDHETVFWIRNMQVDPMKTGGRTVIHGHTPLPLENIERMIQNRARFHEVNVDNGCVYAHDGMNHLLAYFPATNHFVVQKNND